MTVEKVTLYAAEIEDFYYGLIMAKCNEDMSLQPKPVKHQLLRLAKGTNFLEGLAKKNGTETIMCAAPYYEIKGIVNWNWYTAVRNYI